MRDIGGGESATYSIDADYRAVLIVASSNIVNSGGSANGPSVYLNNALQEPALITTFFPPNYYGRRSYYLKNVKKSDQLKLVNVQAGTIGFFIK